MKRSSRVRRLSAQAALPLLGAAWVLWARGVAAAPVVFHSERDDGAAIGPAVLYNTSAETLNLWIRWDSAAASTSGTPCTTGNGDEICGFDVQLVATGNVTLVSFQEETGNSGLSIEAQLTPTGLRVNGLDTASPSGLTRIGRLTVNAQTLGGEVRAAGIEAVGAALQVESIQADLIALSPVPEPGESLLLASGLAGLAGLTRFRRGAVATARR